MVLSDGEIAMIVMVCMLATICMCLTALFFVKKAFEREYAINPYNLSESEKERAENRPAVMATAIYE